MSGDVSGIQLELHGCTSILQLFSGMAPEYAEQFSVAITKSAEAEN